MMSINALQVSFEQIYCAIAEESDKLFWTKLNEKTFASVGNLLEHKESTESFVFIVEKFELFQPVRIKKTLRQWIRCSYFNVIDNLFGATSKSTNDRRVQTVRLDTIQLALS